MLHGGLQRALKAPCRRFDVLRAQVDFGLSPMMRHVRERVPHVLAREHGFASKFVNLLVPLLRRRGFELLGAGIKRKREKLDGCLFIHRRNRAA